MRQSKVKKKVRKMIKRYQSIDKLIVINDRKLCDY